MTLRPLLAALLALSAAAVEAPKAAIAAAERGDWPAVVSACARDFDRAEADERFWLLYGRAAIESGDYRLAGALVEGALVRFPAADEVRRLELGLLARAKRPAELARAATDWLAHHPQDADIWQARAWAARENSDEAGACSALEAAVILRPDAIALRRQLADLLRSTGLPRAALAHYRVLAADPAALARDGLALAAASCASEAGDPALGRRWLAALGEGARQRDALLLEACLAVQAGDPAAAGAAFDTLLAAGERNPRILTWAGHYAEQRGDLAKAEACYGQAMAADGEAAALRLADLQRRTARPDAARATLERHLAAHPGDAAARAMLDTLR